MAAKPKISRADEATVGYTTRPRVYKLDETYRDSSKLASNEFYHWLGVKNSGGIRVRMTQDKRGIAVLVLVSAHVSVATYNPWEDVLDKRHGRLWYWGDAKASRAKTRDDFEGNRLLARIWVAVNEQRWAEIPPILHFTKPAKGQVRFSGLCVLSNLADAWMEERGQRVRNYLATLDILPVEMLDVAWIRERIEDVSETRAPQPWQIYAKTGQYSRLVTYDRNVLSREDQLPAKGSPDDALLHELSALDPALFERVVVRAFESLDVSHDVHGTPYTRDGGFDFHGTFRLPPPLSYSIPFKGEVKRYNPKRGVGPKDVARLVARLQRGEHGMFATTSYFTTQSQEEVLADRYPVELLHGGRLTGLLARCGAVRKGSLDSAWVHALK